MECNPRSKGDSSWWEVDERFWRNAMRVERARVAARVDVVHIAVVSTCLPVCTGHTYLDFIPY